MSKYQSLDEILKTLASSEGRDFEGDRTYRVHIQTARDLVINAYVLGERYTKEKPEVLSAEKQIIVVDRKEARNEQYITC